MLACMIVHVLNVKPCLIIRMNRYDGKMLFTLKKKSVAFELIMMLQYVLV